jgi:hypothetical protein
MLASRLMPHKSRRRNPASWLSLLDSLEFCVNPGHDDALSDLYAVLISVEEYYATRRHVCPLVTDLAVSTRNYEAFGRGHPMSRT